MKPCGLPLLGVSAVMHVAGHRLLDPDGCPHLQGPRLFVRWQRVNNRDTHSSQPTCMFATHLRNRKGSLMVAALPFEVAFEYG